MDNCKLYEDLLVQEALGEISGKERAFLREHLDACPDCRAELAVLGDTIGALRRERLEGAPAGLAERTLKRVERTGERLAAAANPYHETSLLRPETWRVRKSFVGWLVAASILVMATATLVPGIGGTESSRSVVACQERMQILAMALRQYALDHEGVYPAGPEWHMALDHEHLRRMGAFLCPARIAVGAPSESEVDFIYNMSRVSMNEIGDYPLLWDRKGAHDQLGRNVLFADGRVTWKGEEDFEKILARYKINEADLFKQAQAARERAAEPAVEQ